MNLRKLFLLLISLSTTICGAMHLNFKGTWQYIGQLKGNTAVGTQLKDKDPDLLQPLIDMLDTSAQKLEEKQGTQDAFEAEKIFEGFVRGYAGGLLKHNHYNKKKYTFDKKEFKGSFAPEMEQKNNSREKLFAFLTTIFTKAKLLTEE